MVQVHYDEGAAIHIGPESCAGGREAAREALTGECAGQPLSHEKADIPGADAVRYAEGHTKGRAIASSPTTRRGVLRALGREPRIIPAIYVKPFMKGQKNDYNDAEAIAEAALRPNLRVVQEKSQDQLDLQACHRVRSRLVSRRTATINQIRAFLIEQGIAVRAGARALRNSLFAILENRKDEISPRTAKLILGVYEDWCH